VELVLSGYLHRSTDWAVEEEHRQVLLRPPWPPPELETNTFHIKEDATGWTHSHTIEIVGMILQHPHGKLVASLSSITDNKTSSPCAN
jgi:hypothetical protein